MQHARLAAGLQLAAQVGHEHVDGVGLGVGVVVPDLLEQLVARDHQPLVAHQVLQQLELARGQLDRPLAPEHLARVGVQAQVARHQGRASPRRAPPQQRAHPRQQLGALEGLHQVVVGPGVQSRPRGRPRRRGRSASGSARRRSRAGAGKPPCRPAWAGPGRGPRRRARRPRTPPARPRRRRPGGPRSPPCRARGAARPRSRRRPPPRAPSATCSCPLMVGRVGGTAVERLKPPMARRRATRRPTRGPARKRAQARTPALPKLPVLEQHHLDLIGLGLVAFATFLGIRALPGQRGRPVGEATEDASAVPPRRRGVPRAPGALRHRRDPGAAPAAAERAPLPHRRHLPDPGRHPRPGGRVAGAGARARGTRAAPGSGLRERSRWRPRRAAVRVLERALLGAGRPHPVPLPHDRRRAAGHRGLDRGGGQGGRRAREHHHAAGAHRRRADHRCARARHGGHRARGPPEPPGVEPVVHATHVEAPALDAESRYPDLFERAPEDTGEPDPEPVEPAPEEPAATTPAAQEQDDPAVVEAQPDRHGPGAADAHGQPAHRRYRGRGPELRPAARRLPQALQRQAQAQVGRRRARGRASWSSRSATSGSRPRSWAA